VTAADDESIKGAQALLVQFGLTEDQVANLTPLVVDLSRKMGIDMDSAAKAVGKSATGSATALNKMGINVKSLGEGSTDAERTLSALQKSVGGFATAEGQTFNGQLTIMKNQLSEIGEQVGVGAAGTLRSIVGGAVSLTGAINDVNPGLSAAVGSFSTLAAIGVGGLGAISFAAGSFLKLRENVVGVTGALRDANGNLTRFGTAAKNLGTVVIGAAIVGAAIEIGNQFNKASQDAEKFQNALSVLSGGSSGDNLQATADVLNSLVGGLDEFAIKSDQLSKEDFGSRLSTIWNDPLNAIASGFNDISGKGFADSDLVAKFKVGSEEVTADLNQVGEAIDKLKEANSPQATQSFIEGLKGSTADSPEAKLARVEAIAQAGELYRAQINQAAGSRSAAAAAQEDAAAARAAGLATGEYAATSEDLKDKQNELAQSTAGITQAFQINQAAAKGFAGGLDVVTLSANGLIDSAQSVGDAMKAFKAGADGTAAAMAALPTNGIDPATAALGGYTEEQNKAIDAFQQYGAAVQKNLAAQLASGASYDQVRQQAAGYEAFLRDYLVNTLGVAADKVDGYIQQLGLTPDQVNTQITLSGAEQAKQQLQVLQGDFDSLPAEKRSEIYAAISRNDWTGALQIYNQFKDKDVTVGVKLVGPKPGVGNPFGFFTGLPQVQQADGGILKFAAGGMTENRIAQIAPAGAMRLWAEPETGGESYIPLAPSKRKRSMAIWQKTGELLGAQTGRTSGVAIGSINITESQNARLTAAELVRVQRDEAFLMGVS
jgi:hypothetical protein